jgi:hypothetical protein
LSAGSELEVSEKRKEKKKKQNTDSSQRRAAMLLGTNVSSPPTHDPCGSKPASTPDVFKLSCQSCHVVAGWGAAKMADVWARLPEILIPLVCGVATGLIFLLQGVFTDWCRLVESGHIVSE